MLEASQWTTPTLAQANQQRPIATSDQLQQQHHLTNGHTRQTRRYNFGEYQQRQQAQAVTNGVMSPPTSGAQDAFMAHQLALRQVQQNSHQLRVQRHQRQQLLHQQHSLMPIMIDDDSTTFAADDLDESTSDESNHRDELDDDHHHHHHDQEDDVDDRLSCERDHDHNAARSRFDVIDDWRRPTMRVSRPMERSHQQAGFLSSHLSHHEPQSLSSCVDSNQTSHWTSLDAKLAAKGRSLRQQPSQYRPPAVPAKPMASHKRPSQAHLSHRRPEPQYCTTAQPNQQPTVYYQPNLYQFAYFKQASLAHPPTSHNSNSSSNSNSNSNSNNNNNNLNQRQRGALAAGRRQQSSGSSSASRSPQIKRRSMLDANKMASTSLQQLTVGSNQRNLTSQQHHHQHHLKVPAGQPDRRSPSRVSPSSGKQDNLRSNHNHHHLHHHRARVKGAKPKLSFCAKLAKFLLFVANILFWSTGIALGAWGILSLVDDHKYNLSQLLVFEPNSKMSLFQLLSWSFITLGCATILVGFCGCSAMFKNNRWILGLYIFLILAIFALDLATGLLAIIFQERLVANVRLRLANKLRSDYGVQASFTAAIDYIQTRFECCGLDGHFDYDQSIWRLQRLGGFDATVARTCCHLKNTLDDQAHINPRPVNESMCQSVDVRFHQSFRYRKGCLEDLEQLVRQKIWTFTVGCGIAGGVILLSLLFATCFCRSIPGSDETGSRKSSVEQRIEENEAREKKAIATIKQQFDVNMAARRY